MEEKYEILIDVSERVKAKMKERGITTYTEQNTNFIQSLFVIQSGKNTSIRTIVKVLQHVGLRISKIELEEIPSSTPAPSKTKGKNKKKS